MRIVALVMLGTTLLSAQEPAQNRREFTIVAKDHVFAPTSSTSHRTIW